MMQIQTISASNTQSVSALADSVARQNAAATSFMNAGAESPVGGLQKNAVAAAGSLEKQTPVMEKDVDQAVEKINETLQLFSQRLEFSVDKDTDAFVVKVVDKETKEVIRQIPSEELLSIAKALDSLQGLLIKDKA